MRERMEMATELGGEARMTGADLRGEACSRMLNTDEMSS
jgi:hypothetical protein